MTNRFSQTVLHGAVALAIIIAGAVLRTAAAQDADPAAEPAAPTALVPPNAGGAPAAPEAAPAETRAVQPADPTSANLDPAIAADAAAAAATAATADGQPAGSFAGLSQNSDEPIDIESDLLYVYDAKKYATFKGNVVAVQGSTILHSKELDVHYVASGSDSLTGPAKEAPAAEQTAAAVGAAKPEGSSPGGDGTKINKIYARGDVVIDSDDDQTTTSDWALYDLPAQLVTVGGNVVLTQGKNVLKGDRLVIDLKTGESRFENTGTVGTGKRIRALFMPKGEVGTKDTESDDDQSGGTKKKKKAESDAGAPGGAADGESVADQAGAPQDDSQPWQILPGNPQQ